MIHRVQAKPGFPVSQYTAVNVDLYNVKRRFTVHHGLGRFWRSSNSTSRTGLPVLAEMDAASPET